MTANNYIHKSKIHKMDAKIKKIVISCLFTAKEKDSSDKAKRERGTNPR